ncbi:ferritin-like domain-containing protein [Polyangium mundeleinium]|uniref:Ferritin-like domain-containing protein n=1 Tax=Polyangium mundeleinium TaxID=2995306 RepID=A0ABT5ENX2_9BACT|nr:ferritin-like domain-containing protein [Polyangium mundeleinium]MDC0743154.1 ferritin-like domain-containing protein [Polyangium mundeleinium]
MHDRLAFLSLRLSLFAALGLSAIACGSSVENGGSGGAGGSGGSASSSSSSSQGGAGGGGFPGCAGGTPILLANGSDSGYVRCDDDTIHRAAVVACDPTINAPACEGTETNKSCTTDADCTDKPHGKCIHRDASGEDPNTSCGCAYACANDAECGADSVCVCDGVVDNGVAWSRCSVSATCKVDADCPSGECGITSFFDGCYPQVGLACRSDADACRVDADCMGGAACVTIPWNSTPGTFTCETDSCAIGRPLLVAGAARTAPASARVDWILAEITPDTASLDPAVRSALAEAWTEIAALEHASVASFARFTLQLMALGAPPELLFAAQQAAADEVEHARVGYALASRYADRPIGPSKLDLTGVPLDTDPRVVLASLIEEACVGETIGAAEALALAGIVRDPVLREVHARIAEDEQRHAELAWRTLRFLLAGADEDTRRFARATFDRAIEAASAEPSLRRAVVAEDVGLLSSKQIGALRRQALRDVVRPCADALLAPAVAPVALADLHA